MSEHYYTKNPESAHDIKYIQADALGEKFEFETDAGVFSRDGIDPGTLALISALPKFEGRALDLGCGWGAAGLPFAKKNPTSKVVMTDINERAADLAKKNAAKNAVYNVEIVSGDGFENVVGTFDLIFTNPPIRAGKEKIYALFAESKARLNEGGSLYIVIRKQQGAPSALKFLKEIFASAEVVERKGGYWVIKSDI